MRSGLIRCGSGFSDTQFGEGVLVLACPQALAGGSRGCGGEGQGSCCAGFGFLCLRPKPPRAWEECGAGAGAGARGPRPPRAAGGSGRLVSIRAPRSCGRPATKQVGKSLITQPCRAALRRLRLPPGCRRRCLVPMEQERRMAAPRGSPGRRLAPLLLLLLIAAAPGAEVRGGRAGRQAPGQGRGPLTPSPSGI